MNYKQLTKRLGIPVPGMDDRVLPDVEMRKYTIIENMLMAGTWGMPDVVFRDGGYGINDNNQVVLSSTGNRPAVEGLAEGVYFCSYSNITWNDLQDGMFYYLYLRPTPDTPAKSESVRPVSSEHELGKGAVLLATVDFRKNKPKLNTNPHGKMYTADLMKHPYLTRNPHGKELEQSSIRIIKELRLNDDAQLIKKDEDISEHPFKTSNPHGEEVVQDTLQVNKQVELADEASIKKKGRDLTEHPDVSKNPHGSKVHQSELKVNNLDIRNEATVNVDGETIPLKEFIARTAETTWQRRTEYIDFESGGSQGVSVESNAKVVHVDIQRRAKGPMTGELGEVAVGYYGDDIYVWSENRFRVYNDGDEGVPIRASVVYEVETFEPLEWTEWDKTGMQGIQGLQGSQGFQGFQS